MSIQLDISCINGVGGGPLGAVVPVLLGSSHYSGSCCDFIVAAQARAFSAPNIFTSCAEHDAASTEMEPASRTTDEVLRMRTSFASHTCARIRAINYNEAMPGGCAFAAVVCTGHGYPRAARLAGARTLNYTARGRVTSQGRDARV